jgi:hypothetical protein
LPRGFEYLSGVPEAERRRRKLVTIQAYIDDTGLDGRSAELLFSAIFATVEDWAAFSDRWKSVLDETPRIPHFKMDEAVGFTGPFYGWSESKRNLKLMRLAGTFADHKYGFIELAVAADLKAIDEGLRPRATKPANEPYFWPFHITIQAICWALLETSPDYDLPMEIYFDDNAIFGPRAKAWYPVIRAMAEPNVQRLMPVEPFFRDDRTTMPLQAADLTVWMRHADRRGANVFSWLREHMTGLTPLRPIVEFGRAQIDSFFDGTPVPADQQWRSVAAERAMIEHFIKGGARHYVPKPKTRKKKAR